MFWDMIKTVISWIVGFFSKRNQEKIFKKHQKQASLVYKYEKNPAPTFDRLHIFNQGIGKARNIEVYIDNIPIKEWEYSIDEDCDFPEIPSFDEITVGIMDIEDAAMKKRYTILIKWEDDSHEPGIREGIFEIY
jgi:hypothetical protein